jgi:ligand-binding sensor domain-containing protein/signal transduction histidine kinase/DNA-binding response OmpR family regulator
MQSDAYAQKYYFRNLQVEDGLSQNMVYTILQDKQGFIWLGTQDGLNKYNGNSFKIYKRQVNDPQSIGSNMIFSLFQNDDDILWVGTSSGVYLYDPRRDSFSLLNIRTASNDSVSGIVRDIKKDKNGNIWLLASGKGLFCVTPQLQLKQYSLAEMLNVNSVNTRKLTFDSDDHLWIATYQQGLLHFSPENTRLRQYRIGDNSNINDLFLLNEETLLLATSDNGLQAFNLKTNSYNAFLEKDRQGKTLFVRCIYKNTNGELWLGTESGIYIYNLQTHEVSSIQHTYGDPFSISDNAIHSISQDREGGMWVGSYFGGVNYCIEASSKFEKYYPIPNVNSIQGKSISEFCEDDQQHIWIGTEDAGLNLFDPKTESFKTGFIPATNIHDVLYENHKLWIGTFSDGLYVMDMRNGRTKVYKHSSDNKSLYDNNVYSIYKDYTGTIWIGTLLGLHKYNESTDDFERVYGEEITQQVNDILEDQNGVLWFATLGKGLFSYDKYGKKWKNYAYLTADKNSNMVICMLKDSRNHLWMGTEGAGLCMYDFEEKKITQVYTVENGLPNNVIYMLLEDARGNIWGSTNHGLFRLNAHDGQILKFNHVNGLLCDQFNYKSGFKSHDGKLYFGGTRGFISFYPEKLWPNSIVPPVVFDNLYIYNTEVIPGEKSVLKQSISYTEAISIPSEVSVFSIGFASLSYVSPQANQYMYKLVGKDQDWVHSVGTYRVTYSDLPPGDYVFKVKASNNDDLWNEEGTSILIHVLPPFYRTLWAYLTYILLIGLILYLLIRWYINRIYKKNKQVLESMEINKEKELYNAKIEFFTNITHEIRTPLSLIKAPLDEVMKHIDKENGDWENMLIIQRNANRLLKLVNELLDFRKAESKGLRLNFVHVDVIAIIKETIDRFLTSIQLKGIYYRLELPEDPFFADVDVEIFTKILSNVFNNAFKHGQNYIHIAFSENAEMFRLRVTNGGENIPAEFSQKIFDPFFRLNKDAQGAGLGLPFTKSLIELHKGTIVLDNSKDYEITFIIELPVHQDIVIRLEPGEAMQKTERKHRTFEDMLKLDNRKIVLSIEDNEEFQEFLCKQLSADYQVLKSNNGLQAMTLLDDHNVDLILCDVMMPVMDGFTFCKELKTNVRYSHIPIILLTAKTTLQSKIEGLNVGADEYIEKPYSIDFLRARIENLLENRRKIKESYKKSPELNYETIAHSKADEVFLNNLIEAIYARLDEIELDVNRLAVEMNMSRATLYRKIKSISELTPNDFIRLIRLKKAAELLIQKEYRVNEIAYIVGFRSSSYFSKCFQKQFGVLPKDFEKSRTN